MKKVSVIIPVYKVEKYIRAALESALLQSYKSFEILIIDDGSPDKSIEICQQFLDPRIKIIRQENRGLAEARNTGIRHASGEYIAFLDGDDVWLPGKLERHIEHLNSSPGVGISFSCSEFIGETGLSLHTFQRPKLKNITPEYMLCCNPVGNGSAGVFRRQVFEAIAFQDKDNNQVYFDKTFPMSQDIECWLRIVIQTAWQIEGIPEPLTLYRITSGAISANLVRRVKMWENLFDKVKTYAPELIAQWGIRAMAYRFSSLSREALRRKDSSLAVEMIHRALTTYPFIVVEQSRSTVSILVAAYLIRVMPQRVYCFAETITFKTISSIQKLYSNPVSK